MKTINLVEIAKNSFPIDEESGFMFNQHNLTTQKLVIKAMEEACKQTITLCAENASVYIHKNYPHEITKYDVFVDKQSIINTINQIE